MPSFQCFPWVGAASLLRILGMSTQVLPFKLTSRARIAVVGAGISGITAARELDSEHDVTLYESRGKAGGHTRTLRFERFGREFRADLGFMVFNEANYPHLTRLLAELEIPTRDTEMSFSLRCDRSGLEYHGSTMNQLFAQRRNLFRPGHYRMMLDILRFNRDANKALAERPQELTEVSVGEFLARGGYSPELANDYLLPMTAAIWSSSAECVERFPSLYLLRFMANHMLLGAKGHRQWSMIPGGADQYVDAALSHFQGRIKTGSPVRLVETQGSGARVETDDGIEQYDAVVLAVHSDQALKLIGDPTPLERQVLGVIPYHLNEAVVHTDRRVLPRRRLAWASWNYYRAPGSVRQASVTYNLNILQHLRSPEPICLTLNPLHPIRPEKIITTLSFTHPLFSADAFSAQGRVAELNNSGNRFFCGAWTGWGFHEDGLVSGLRAADGLREWAAHRENQAKSAYAQRNLRGLGQAYPAQTG